MSSVFVGIRQKRSVIFLVNPFNASYSKLLLSEGSSAILV